MNRLLFACIMVTGVLLAASGSYPTLRDGYGWTTSTCTNQIDGASAKHASITNVAFSCDEHGSFVFIHERKALSAASLTMSNNWVRKTLYFTLPSADPIFFSKTFRMYVYALEVGKTAKIYTQVENRFPSANGELTVTNFSSGLPGGDRSVTTKLMSYADQVAGFGTVDILIEGFTTSPVVNITFGPVSTDQDAKATTLVKTYIYHEAGY